MLQQTRVAHALPYFENFTARWPNVRALAAAEDGDVLAAWAGLGYYARARNLLACARKVATEHQGRFPEEEEQLLRLPGIGRYTAAAIAAIAFGRPAVAVDANVERIIARLHAIATPLPQARAEIHAFAAALTPPTGAGLFVEAMMALGQLVCTPRAPDCPRCPLRASCRAFASGTPEAFPVRPPKKAKPKREGSAWWLEHEDHVLLVRRPPAGLLGGMLALPDDAAPAEADWQEAGTVDHAFTHFALTMQLYCARVERRPPNADHLWWPIERMCEAGLPSLFARLAERGIGWRQAA